MCQQALMMLTVAMVSVVMLATCGVSAQQQPLGDVVSSLTDAEIFKSFLEWLKIARLDSTLEGEGPFTVLAPNDAAFESLSPSVIWKLKSDNEFLSTVLKYHIVQGDFTGTKLAQLRQIPTLNGEVLEVEEDAPGVVRVVQASGDANMPVRDIRTTNGLVHIIDKLILPPSLQEEANLEEVLKRAGNVNTFLGLVERAGLEDVLREGGPLTVFAPTDAAFASVDPSILRQLKREPRLLKAVILSHMVGKDLSSFELRSTTVHENSLGELIIFRTFRNSVLVNTARVLQEDLIAKNGALHIINGLLLPSINALGSQGPTATTGLLDKIKMSGLSIFYDLVQSSGIFLILQANGPLTVFGPSNKALSELPREDVQKLMTDKTHLRITLLRHILPEGVPTNSFQEDLSVDNFAREKTRLNIYKRPSSANRYTANGVPLSVVDERATNGILHVIPRMVPSATKSTLDILLEDRRFTTFLSGVQASDLIVPIKTDGNLTIFAATNAAFQTLPQEDFFSILLDLTRLATMLGNHVVASNGTGQQTLYSAGLCWTSFKSASGQTMRTAMGSDGHVLITSPGNRIVRVVEEDIVTKDGVIHVVDGIL